MKKRITLWSVEYRTWGMNGTARYWFRTYEEAKEFAKQDYTDIPVKHTFTEENARPYLAMC